MLLRSLAIWLAMFGACSAQTFVGPSSANVGESVAVRVTGVTLPAAPAEAAKAVLVAVDSPDETRPASLFGGVFWDFATGQPQLLLFFRAETSGVYVLSAVAPKEATPKIVSKRIAVGEVVPPTPNPIPPGPGPNPTPNPTPQPPPIAKGPRLIVLVREASHVTPAQARTEIDLRSGPVADALKAKGHTLLILSDDRGLPPAMTDDQKLAVQLAMQSGKPRIVVCVPSRSGSDSVLLNQEYTSATTAAQFLSIIEANGG